MRITGLDQIVSTPLSRLPTVAPRVLTPGQIRARNARRTLAARGLVEAMTWSFVPKSHAEAFGGGQPELALANPIAFRPLRHAPEPDPRPRRRRPAQRRPRHAGHGAVRGRPDLPRRPAGRPEARRRRRPPRHRRARRRRPPLVGVLRPAVGAYGRQGRCAGHPGGRRRAGRPRSGDGRRAGVVPPPAAPARSGSDRSCSATSASSTRRRLPPSTSRGRCRSARSSSTPCRRRSRGRPRRSRRCRCRS